MVSKSKDEQVMSNYSSSDDDRERPLILDDYKVYQDSDPSELQNKIQSPFENCETYSEIMDQLDDMRRNRKKRSKYYMDGNNSCLKKFLFYLQTFYPMLVCILYLGFLLSLINRSNSNNENVLLNKVAEDWFGKKIDFSLWKMISNPVLSNHAIIIEDDRKTYPINEIKVIDNDPTKTAEEQCHSTFHWHKMV
jgi:hypothetical protein